MSNPSKRRILVIDDNGAIHDDFRKTLTGQNAAAELEDVEAALFGAERPKAATVDFDVDSAFQGQEGFDKVAEAARAGRPYSLAFVDMRMPPGWDGVQTIEQLWTADPDLQVVICTAYSDYSWSQIIEKLGMTDQLLILKKPFDNIEVCQLATALTEKWSLTRQARIQINEMEKIVQERTAEIAEAALHDKLTGLPNRAFFNDRLGKALQRAHADPRHRFAVLFLDFDGFKVVNDSLGHEIGDLLLTSIADRLRRRAEAIDECEHATAARLGGDEFIILLDGLREDGAAVSVAEQIMHSLAAPYCLKGYDVHSTASIGITTSEGNYQRAEDVIRDADTAMYRAKAAGKARYMVFDQQMHAEAVARLTMEHDLRKALERNELIVHYQPIVSLEDRRLVSFEALVRWQHPTKGMVSPNDFIPLAEETGLIVPLGHQVMQTACRQLASWHAKYPEHADLSMSINLSRKQLAAPTLLSDIRRILQDTGAAPQRIKLEITESWIMDDTEAAVELLKQIRQLGIRLDMDDFGTGYSSLSCLHRFPINGLKIDRAFVKNVNGRRDYAAVINGIIVLAHNLDIKLVAEGVEDAEQVALLQMLECDHAQGFYFAKPMTPAAAEQYIEQHGRGTVPLAA